MAPWLRVLLWIVVLVVPGGLALLPVLAVDMRRSRMKALAQGGAQAGEGA